MYVDMHVSKALMNNTPLMHLVQLINLNFIAINCIKNTLKENLEHAEYRIIKKIVLAVRCKVGKY